MKTGSGLSNYFPAAPVGARYRVDRLIIFASPESSKTQVACVFNQNYVSFHVLTEKTGKRKFAR